MSNPEQLLSSPVIHDAESVPPRVWPAFTAFFAAIVGQIVVGITVFLGTMISRGVDFTYGGMLQVLNSPSVLWTLVVLGTVAVGGAALGAALLSKTPWRERLRLRLVNLRPMMLLMGCFGVLGIGYLLQAMDQFGWIPPSDTLEMLDKMIRGASGFRLVVAVLVIGIAPGITEEFLFRGYIQTRLSQRWGPAWGIAIASVLFGVMHFDLVQSSYATLMGVFLGYVVERTGTIVPAMIFHAVNNTFSTIVAAYNLDQGGDSSPAWLILLLGVSVTVVAFLYIRRLQFTAQGRVPVP